MTTSDSGKQSSGTKGKTLAAFVVLAVAVFLVYAHSLPYGFLPHTDDNIFVLESPYLAMTPIEFLGAVFTHAYAGDYLPFTHISLYLDQAVWGKNASGFRLTNLFLHSLIACLFFLLLMRMSLGVGAAFAASLLYAVHPVNVESVVWIAERKNLLSAVFILLTFHFYLSYDRDSVERRASYWGALGFMLAALLAKSIAVVVPMILVLYDYFFSRRGIRLSTIREKIPFFILSLCGSLMTLVTQDMVGVIQDYPSDNPLHLILFSLRIQFDYMGSFLLPLTLSPMYKYSVRDLLTWQSFAAATFVAALYAVAFVFRRRIPVVSFCFAWFVVFLLPVMGIVPITTPRADRYLSMPAMALALIATLPLVLATSKRRELRIVCACVVALLVVALGFLTVNYSRSYANERAMWERTAAMNPAWAKAAFEAGYWRWREGDMSGARVFYEKALAIDPDHAMALRELGAILIDCGELEKARPYIERALKKAPDNPIAIHNMAVIVHRLNGDDAAARRLLDKEAAIVARTPTHAAPKVLKLIPLF